MKCKGAGTRVDDAFFTRYCELLRGMWVPRRAENAVTRPSCSSVTHSLLSVAAKRKDASSLSPILTLLCELLAHDALQALLGRLLLLPPAHPATAPCQLRDGGQGAAGGGGTNG